MRNIVLFYFVSITFGGFAQKTPIVWFPGSIQFTHLVYDLHEEQFYTGAFLLNGDDVNYEGAYIPVNIGLKKPLIQWDGTKMKVQFVLGAASFTQFEIIRYDEHTLRGGLLNNDYKASAYLTASNQNRNFRLQLFHISSHLGDDYMLRNEYFELNDKTVNYEQLDLIYLHELNNLSAYGGLGVVITPNTFRKRLMLQLGAQGLKPLSEVISVAYGADVKIYEEHNYLPNVHAGCGINITKGKPQLNFSVDSYFGKIPYSTLKMGKVFWLGVSTIVYI